jgi:hypothetical protein
MDQEATSGAAKDVTRTTATGHVCLQRRRCEALHGVGAAHGRALRARAELNDPTRTLEYIDTSTLPAISAPVKAMGEGPARGAFAVPISVSLR